MITITNLPSYIDIDVDGVITTIGKEDLMARALLSDEFGIYQAGYAVFKGKFEDVVSPVTADINALVREIGSYFVNSTTTTTLEAALEAINSNIGKTYFQRMLENDFSGTIGGFSTQRRKPLTIGVEEVIWEYPSATYPFPAAAAVVDVVSDNANDDGIAPLSGAQQVAVVGLDGTGTFVFDVVTMNGLTPVTTTKTFLRTFAVFVAVAGSTGYNEGNITVEHLGNVVDYMGAGNSTSSKAVGAVPSNYAMFIDADLIATDESDVSSAPVTFRIYTRDITSGIRTKTVEVSTKDHISLTEIPVGGFNDIYMTAQCDTLGATVNVETRIKSIIFPTI